MEIEKECQFKNLFTTQILREINFRESESPTIYPITNSENFQWCTKLQFLNFKNPEN